MASDDDDAGSRAVLSPSAVEVDFIPAQSANWWTPGPEKGSWYGYSVASAGNVDGYWGDDVLVGAPKYGLLNGEGTVYLFLNTGGGLSTTPNWEKSGGVQGANFGWSVARAGDVNGDGLDDVIIGAPNYKTVNQVGRAFVYQGDSGLGLSIEATWSYTGTVQDAEFGDVVAGAGDVNGDDIDDVVVGSRYYTDQPDTETKEGAVFVFFGQQGSKPSAQPDWIIDGDQVHAYLGSSVSAAGDVNGDGYDDLMVGAPGLFNPETGLIEGAALLFLGGAAAPTSYAWIAYGEQAYSRFGTVVAGAGDVNGDGHPDVVVSTPSYDRPSDGAEAGAAFAFCGNGVSLGLDPCWTVYGAQLGTQFGASAGGAGDVNADGYDDVIVGAPLYEPTADLGFEGAAFIYHGSGTGLSPWSTWKAGGDRARTDFGQAVASAGRVTDDEATGVIIGAPQYFKETDPFGAAFVFYGPLEPQAPDRVFLPVVLRNH